jgi:SAM-dependent methyltransferase
MESHYNSDYFEWQKSTAQHNTHFLKKRFSKFISKNSSVLDFGCGGGFLLNSLDCQEKIGFDINLRALNHLKELGIKSCNNLNEINENSIDIIISNHCLEHIPNPLVSIKELKTKLKNNGQIILIVPHETIGNNYKPGDINYHLYTWSPLTLGNLFSEAGFEVINVKAFREISLPKEDKLNKFIPKVILNILRKPYRVLRIIFDELNIKKLETDGEILIHAVSRN